MTEELLLADQFERNRTHLRAVAYRMLGSAAEADDAVQDVWFRLSRADTTEVENLSGWLTTVVARVCLDRLRSRTSRREDPLEEAGIDSAGRPAAVDPADEVAIADSVGLALLVVLEALAPAERLAFVLHDLFAVPFDEIAPIVDRTPQAARKLASRARARIQGERAVPDADLATQRRVTEAFLAAAHEGDFEALLEVLDPDVVLRADFGALPTAQSRVVRGAQAVASQAMFYSQVGLEMRPALVNGAVGAVSLRDGRPFSVAAVTVNGGRIVEMDFLVDRERLAQLDLTILDD